MEPVSVIIPTYNRASLITRAIRSVAGQQGFCGEIIVIDDGSTDATEQVVGSLQVPAVLRYIRIANSGAAAARNRGIAEAEYDLVAFLDSDDHWAAGKLVRQQEAMRQNPAFAISHTGERWLRRGEHLNQKRIHQPRHGDIFAHCLRLCAVGMSTVIMEKRLFRQHGGFDPQLPCCEDYDLWLRLSSCEPFLLVDAPLTVKEGGRPDQLSSIFRVGMDKFRIRAIEKLLRSAMLAEHQRNLALAELTRKCRVYGNGCIKHGKPQEGRRYLALPKHYENGL